jgi:tetratricopeptide (TPR) repeat protein
VNSRLPTRDSPSVSIRLRPYTQICYGQSSLNGESSIEVSLDRTRVQELQGKDRQANMELLSMWDDLWKGSLHCPPGLHSFPASKDVVKLLYRRLDEIYVKTHRKSMRRKLSSQLATIMTQHFESGNPKRTFEVARMFDQEGKKDDAIAYYEKCLNLYRGSSESTSTVTALSAAIRLSQLYQSLGDPKESPSSHLKAYELLISSMKDIKEDHPIRLEMIRSLASAAAASDRVADLRWTWESLADGSTWRHRDFFRAISQSLVDIYCANGDLKTIRDFWVALRKYKATIDIFVELAKSFGGLYAKAGQETELKSLCRTLEDAFRYAVESTHESTLRELYDLLNLNSKEERTVNKALSMLDDDTKFFILRGIDDVWKDVASLQQILDESMLETKAMIEKDSSIRTKRGDELYIFLMRDIYVRLRHSIRDHPNFGPLHVCTAVVTNQIADYSIRLGEKNEAFDLLQQLYDRLIDTGGFSSEEMLSLGSAVAKTLGDFCAYDTTERNQAREMRNKLSMAILTETRKRFSLEDEPLFEYFEDCRQLLLRDNDHGRLKGLYESFWAKRPHAWTSKGLSRIGLGLAEYYYARESKSHAVRTTKEVCSHDILVFGETDETTVAAWNLLSEFYTAEDNYEESLMIHSSLMGKIDPDSDRGKGLYAQQVNLKGRALQRLGRWEEAEKVYMGLWRFLARGVPMEFWRNKSQNIQVWKDRAQEREAPTARTWNDDKLWRGRICDALRP